MGSLTPRDLPLGLRLEHGAGHTAFLAAADVRVGDLVAIERLRLALPGVWTRHDTSADRIATTRPALSALRATLSESALNAHLAAALDSPDIAAQLAHSPALAGLRAVVVRLHPGCATLFIWRTLPDDRGDALTTCRLFVAPSGDGTLTIELFEPRAYGQPGDSPPACVVRDVLSALFELPGVVGRVADDVAGVDSRHEVAPRVRRDRVVARPLEMLLTELVTRLGWKLPVRSPALVCRFALEDGCLVVDARDLSLEPDDDTHLDRLAEPPEVRAERAELEQARRVLRNADAAMFAGQVEPALDLLRALRQRLGHHPSLLARLGALLLVRPSPAHLDELARLCAEALRQQPDLHIARLLDAQVRAARHPEAPAEAAHALRALLGYLDAGTRALDRICVLLAVARLERDTAPARAVSALREAARLDPTLAAPLEALDDCYARHGEHAARLEVLQRLASLTRRRPRRARLLLRLAEALHDTGADARALGALHAAAELVEPDDAAALGALAECAARIGEATVAIELFGRVADVAEQADDAATVARACLRSAELWLEVGAATNARLACHSALAADPTCVPATRLLVQTSLHVGDPDSASATLEELITRLEHAVWARRASASTRDAPRDALVEACRMLASVANERGDAPTANTAWRRLLVHAPGDDDAFESLSAALPPAERVDLLHGRIGALLERGARDEAAAHMLELSALYERELGLPGDALAWTDRALELSPGDLALQRRRVALLEVSGHHGEDLRVALEQMVARVVEPAARASLLVRLARIELDTLGDVESACENLHRAVALCPTDAATLLELRRALSRAGRTEELVGVLERLARLTDSPRSRRDFLVEAGDAMHERLGRPHQARRLYRQALASGPDPAIERRLQRLDTRRPPTGGWARPPTPPATLPAPPPASGPPTDIGPIVDDAIGPAPSAPPTDDTGAVTSDLEPALPTPVSAELDVRFAGPDAESFDPAAFFALEPDDGDDLDESASGDAFAAPDPGQAPDWRDAARQWTRPASTATPSSDSMPSSWGRPLEPSASTLAAPGADESVEVARPAGVRSAAELDADIEAARRSQDPARLADLLEQALVHADDTQRRARLHQELGCVTYYDLDDAERARDHLELASQADPDGVGLEAETLTALEGIYEDLDEPAELAAVWERRLVRPGSAEMATVYRLLAAQLYHEQLADETAARRHLEAVLAENPRHEPALRLCIELERQAGHAALAAELLERLVDQLGEDRGAVAALLPELAEQHELAGQLDEARRCLQRAVRLSDSPLGALERLKRLCRAHDDWHGLLDALLEEVALQIGADGPGESGERGLEALMSLEASQVPAARVVGLCQTLREIADILSFKLDADEQAWRLYGRILVLAPEDAYALERRIELSRLLGRWPALAHDLTRLASMLLDPALQLDALADAAILYRDRLGDRLRARELLTEAVSLFADDPRRQPPPRLAEVERDLAHLEETVVVRVSLGTGLHKVPSPPADAFDLDLDLDDGAGARLAAIDVALESEHDRGARVELLVEKGRLASQRLEGHPAGILALREALALSPDHVPARMALIDALLVSGEVEQALNHLIVLAQQPAPVDSPAVHDELVELAEAIVATGRPGVAQRARSLLERLELPSTP